ncbi:MAG: dihydrodipicolinate reductase [Halioglobus sp.]|nr:dihydrodipicolinate reductase [Halioglobus sp.]
MSERLKVIQWATGGVGRAAIENIMVHPELELTGCWVHSEQKAGQDAGELCGLGSIGVTASNDIDTLVALDADCVMYSPIMPDPELVKRFLVSGKNVVTPLNWFYPDRNDVADLENACQRGNSTLHGTGIHPGGITERFPLMVSALSASITHVRAEEFSDIRTYNAPAVVSDIMLFGKTPEDARQSAMTQLLGGGFGQSMNMVAAELGFDIDPEVKSTHDIAVATRPIESPIGVIEPGLVAAQRFTWQRSVRSKPVITVRVNWFMGEEHLEPGWNFGPDGERFEVEIEGDPSSHVTFHGWHPESVAAGLVRNPGIIATANHCVSAIPYVCNAAAGVKTYLDLPLIAGRAAPELSV